MGCLYSASILAGRWKQLTLYLQSPVVEAAHSSDTENVWMAVAEMEKDSSRDELGSFSVPRALI